MKNLIFVLMTAMFLFGASGQVYAADTVSVTATAENAAAVKKGVEELGKLFAVETPQQAAQPQQAPAAATPAPAAPQKNMADVMDKAIDKVSDVVGAMAQSIKGIAPEIWRIMLKQQYAKAAMACIVPFGVTCMLLAYMWVVGAHWKPAKTESRDVTEYEARLWLVRILPIFCLCITGLWLFNRLADSIALLINPEFYAIQDLLRMILNKGM